MGAIVDGLDGNSELSAVEQLRAEQDKFALDQHTIPSGSDLIVGKRGLFRIFTDALSFIEELSS
jgi:hypothetical protein